MPNQPDKQLRATLPIPVRAYTGLVKYDAKDPEAKFPPIEPLRPPAGAPNVLIILLDDVGFGASSAFGGPCQTPTAERLAAKVVALRVFADNASRMNLTVAESGGAVLCISQFTLYGDVRRGNRPSCGRRSTRAVSTAVGTRCGRRFWPVRRIWASCRPSAS